MIIYNKFYIQFLLLALIPIITLIISYVGVENGPTICIFTNILGINCTGCGMTRAIITFINGDFNQAINYNFNVIIILPLLLIIWFKQFFSIMYRIN